MGNFVAEDEKKVKWLLEASAGAWLVSIDI